MNIRITLAAAALAFSQAGTAQAAPLTWFLQDVVFEDGGTAFGSYVFDADISAPQYSSIDITTTNPGGTVANVYDDFPSLYPGTSDQLTFSQSQSLSGGDPVFIMALAAAMTNAGGTISIDQTGAFFSGALTCIDVAPCVFFSFDRRIASGSVTTTPVSPVPLPAGLPLLLAGFCGLGLLARKKHRAQV